MAGYSLASTAISRRSLVGFSLTAVLALSPVGRAVARAAAGPPAYKLPWPGGIVWRVIQGINSGRSHTGRAAFSWDFRMPEGSPITAARAGTVWMVKQDSTQHCFDLSCPDWNNYIVVDHGDGTSAAYLHGMTNGARVRVGDRVAQGQLLGLSDNTGQSGGPHLHFQVQHNDSGRYLSQSFLIGFEEVADNNGVPVVREEYRSANSRLMDFDIREGHYFTQTNGSAGGGGRGFSVTDEDDTPLWSSFKSAGGAAVAGYPISRRFRIDGSDHIFQLFQKLAFDWDPSTKQLQLMNLMDLLHDAGLDGWLLQNRDVPVEGDFAAADHGRSWAEVIKDHQVLLDAQPQIKAAYFSVPDPLSRFGLPMSGLIETPDALTLRTQRAVFQLWRQDTPWAKAGQVTLANAGELARDAQLFSQQIFEPEERFPEEMLGPFPLPWEPHGPQPAFAFGR
ncbi:MAG: M23 family metallopeptidase [Chloroflexota bacterium]|nr:M23 family metallopeptidase [Chloroflexota bacterium]